MLDVVHSGQLYVHQCKTLCSGCRLKQNGGWGRLREVPPLADHLLLRNKGLLLSAAMKSLVIRMTVMQQALTMMEWRSVLLVMHCADVKVHCADIKLHCADAE